MGCSTESLIEEIGDRWVLHILHRLASGTHRTQALLQMLKGISSRTLAAKLKDLEAAGWIERKVYPEVPPRVEYQLTEKGLRLRPLFAAMKGISEGLTSTTKKKAAIAHGACPSCEVPAMAIKEEAGKQAPELSVRRAAMSPQASAPSRAGSQPTVSEHPKRPSPSDDIVLL